MSLVQAVGYGLLAAFFCAVVALIIAALKQMDAVSFMEMFDWVEQNAERHEFFVFREAVQRRPLSMTKYDLEVFEILASRAPDKYARAIRDIAKLCSNQPIRIDHA